MISLESEVLQRHLPLFSGKSILLAGGINDDFPQILEKHCQSVLVWSWYFDYAKTQSAVNFDRTLCINDFYDLYCIRFYRYKPLRSLKSRKKNE